MNIAHILPVSIVDKVPRQPVEMYLTHLVLKYPETFKKVSNIGTPHQVKILDNSNYELHRPCTIAELSKAASIVGATEIVLPDMLWSYHGTIYSTYSALAKYKGDKKVVAVAQGRTWSEVFACAAEFCAEPDIDVVGLPKYLADPKLPENLWRYKGRLVMLYRLKEMFPNQVFHFFGSTGGWEELVGGYLRDVRSMDTSLWMMYARLDLPIELRRKPNLEADVEHDVLPPEVAQMYIEVMNEFLMRGCQN